MLKLKLQYFGHLMQRTNSLESDRGWDVWKASPTQWIWVWANSGRWWKTVKPGVLQSMRSQRLLHNLVTEQQQQSPLQPTSQWKPSLPPSLKHQEAMELKMLKDTGHGTVKFLVHQDKGYVSTTKETSLTQNCRILYCSWPPDRDEMFPHP